MLIKRIEHTAIMATNMDESIKFYTEILGLRVRDRGKNARREMAFLYHPNERSYEIELMEDLQPRNIYSEKGLVNHLAFTVENMEEAVQFLKEHDIVIHNVTPNIAIDGAKTVFFSGPNNELLQFVER
ncbi:VOC family protein [Sutcliffiella cohnii]|uniref:VOC family protein n=1 Tax=Sutcliffiella cohnii TaxID=33932 RepID=UPI002E1E01B9|nr:VOC family protein [Sutcliffiella cohnii]